MLLPPQQNSRSQCCQETVEHAKEVSQARKPRNANLTNSPGAKPPSGPENTPYRVSCGNPASGPIFGTMKRTPLSLVVDGKMLSANSESRV